MLRARYKGNMRDPWDDANVLYLDSNDITIGIMI